MKIDLKNSHSLYLLPEEKVTINLLVCYLKFPALHKKKVKALSFLNIASIRVYFLANSIFLYKNFFES